MSLEHTLGATSEENELSMADSYADFLIANNIRIPKHAFTDYLRHHPSFPSITAFMDIAEELSLPVLLTESYPDDKESLHGGLSVFVEPDGFWPGHIILDSSPTQFKIKDDTGVFWINKEEHFGMCNQRLLLVDKTQTGVHEIYKKPVFDKLVKRESKFTLNKRLRNFCYVSFGTILTSLLLVQNASASQSIFILSAFVGLYLSLSLVAFYHGRNINVGLKICDATDPNNAGCKKVLDSKWSRAWPVDPPSIALAYFLSISLTAMVALVVPKLWLYLSYLSVAGLILAVISIMLQAVVIRAWCKLCLALAAVLFLQCLVCLPMLGMGVQPDTSVLLLMLIFVFVFSLTLQVSQHWEAIVSYPSTQIDLFRTKSHPNYIHSFLRTGEVDFGEQPNDIVLGDIYADVELQLLISLDCFGCALIFSEVRELVHNSPDGLQVRIRLKPAGPISINGRIWHLVEQGQHSIAFDLLGQMFDEAKERLSQQINDTQQLTDSQQLKLDALKKWFQESGIEYTPFIAINNMGFENTSVRHLTFMLRKLVRQKARKPSSDLV